MECVIENSHCESKFGPDECVCDDGFVGNASVECVGKIISLSNIYNLYIHEILVRDYRRELFPPRGQRLVTNMMSNQLE